MLAQSSFLEVRIIALFEGTVKRCPDVPPHRPHRKQYTEMAMRQWDYDTWEISQGTFRMDDHEEQLKLNEPFVSCQLAYLYLASKLQGNAIRWWTKYPMSYLSKSKEILIENDKCHPVKFCLSKSLKVSDFKCT